MVRTWKDPDLRPGDMLPDAKNVVQTLVVARWGAIVMVLWQGKLELSQWDPFVGEWFGKEP